MHGPGSIALDVIERLFEEPQFLASHFEPSLIVQSSTYFRLLAESLSDFLEARGMKPWR